MGKRGSGEMKKVVEEGQGKRNQNCQDQTQHHPYAFHVSGPRKLPSLNWKDLITSSWKDSNYKRTVMACFIQAVYLLELDRQENRTNTQNALAPNWWTPFKFKLAQTLIDDRDGSIFGAILEWDRSSALSDLILIRPNNAPKAVLAFRGTLLKSPTIRRDIEDDLRFLAWESLKGSIRFTSGLKALRSICEKYGSANVCIAGHSLGAGFALQVGKALAKEGICVEAHLFNPPSVSLSSSLKSIGERAGDLWKRVTTIVIRSQPINDESANVVSMNLGGGKKWIPHLYLNDSDYICCYYTDSSVGVEERGGEKENVKGMNAAAKMFVLRKGNQKFLEAHGLEQWWSDDLELQMALDNSKLISRQLQSLYCVPPSEQSLGKVR